MKSKVEVIRDNGKVIATIKGNESYAIFELIDTELNNHWLTQFKNHETKST